MMESYLSSSIHIDPKTVQSSSGSQDSTSAAHLKQTCSEMESLFIFYLLKEMRESIPESGLLGGGETEKLYTSMLDQELAREIASKREIGLSEMLYRQFMNQKSAAVEGKDSDSVPK